MFFQKGKGTAPIIAGAALGMLTMASWAIPAFSDKAQIELSGRYLQTFVGETRMVCHLIVAAKNRGSRPVVRLIVGLAPDPHARRWKSPPLPAKAKKATEVNEDTAGRDCRSRMFKSLKVLECRYAGGSDCRKDVQAQIRRKIGKRIIRRD